MPRTMRPEHPARPRYAPWRRDGGPRRRLGAWLGLAAAALLLALVAVLLALGLADRARGADAVTPPPSPATWQWQLSGRLDTSVGTDLVDVDAQTTSAAQVAALRARGAYVVCYVDVGSWERFRPDAGAFPAAVLGRSNGWPGERWLDVRRLDVLAPILAARLEACRAKGFDAVEPDNVDGYANRTGFPLTAADQLAFDRWVADEAHRLGLAVALKNDLGQARALEPSFDFALLEQCVQYRECGEARPFVAAGKLVLDAEYHAPYARSCRAGRAAGVQVLLKRLRLDAWRRACPPVR